jgi:PEGA domain-containing protein
MTMSRYFFALLFAAILTTTVYAQTDDPTPTPTPAPVAPADRPRVFITDSQSWETNGAAGGVNGAFGASSSGGARPQTAEIIKTFGERCPNVMVNNIQSKANYIVVLDHEGGKAFLAHRNKVAVFDAKSGDSVISKSTLSLGGSVEEACKGIAAHWANHKPAEGAAADDPPARAQPAATAVPAVLNSGAPAAAANPAARLNIKSNPDAADIEIDGNFVGNTPSSLQLLPGDHNVVIKKPGYKNWERKLKVVGGEVNLRAELEKN